MPSVDMKPSQFPYSIQNLAKLSGHDDRVWKVAWNPVEPILASCSADKSVRLYTYSKRDDPQAGSSWAFKHLNTIHTGHTKTVRTISWSPSGTTLATGSFDSNIGIWQPEDHDEQDEDDPMNGTRRRRVGPGDWECVSLLEGHETECKDVAYSSTGALLASCSRDKTVWVWEAQAGADFECLAVLMEHNQDVKCVAWHPKEEILASASYDDTIKLYVDDPDDDWYCFNTLTGHSSTVWSLTWSPTGEYLASASDDKTIRIWRRLGNQHQWGCALTIESGHDRTVYSISWGSGPKLKESLGWLASCGGDGQIIVRELSAPSPELPGSALSNRVVAKIEDAHGVHDINHIAWCPVEAHEGLLATAGDDGCVQVWRVVEGD